MNTIPVFTLEMKRLKTLFMQASKVFLIILPKILPKTLKQLTRFEKAGSRSGVFTYAGCGELNVEYPLAKGSLTHLKNQNYVHLYHYNT